MPTPVPSMPFAEMLFRAQQALQVNAKGLAAILEISPRTLSRYYAGRGGALDSSVHAKLAAMCHPILPELAAHFAAYAGETLLSLGLERPPAPPAALAPPPPPPPAPTPVVPSAPHLADSIVCAAAEALDMSPRVMRPALRAALERMAALGMTADAVVAALTPRPAVAPKRVSRKAP